jgi:Tfp pilus assembly protein PilE
MRAARLADHGRQGLTLMELVIVLLVLIALAGIVLPMLPNMITRSHTAAAATNITEISKAIQTFEGLQGTYPDGWDALTDGTTIADYVPGGTGADLTTGTLTGPQVANLSRAGISTLYSMIATKAALDTAGQSPTFNPYSTPFPGQTAVTLTSGTVALLGPTGILKLNLSTTGTYLVVGLGKPNKMVGRTINDVPYHFLDDPGSTPNDVYTRYVAIFKVSDTAAPTMSRAVLVTVAGLHDDGVAGADAHIQEYFNAVKSTN